MGFCKKLKRATKTLGFHLMLKIANLQDIIYTSMADDIKINFEKLYHYKSNSIPSVETQLMFNEATQKNYRTSYDEYYTETRIISHMIVQVDICSAQQVSSPEYLTCAHQAQNRIDGPNKINNIAIIDNLDLRRYYVEIDGPR